MDALVTDEGDPWNPNDKTVTAIDSLCTEALKVIKPGGALIQISFQQVRGGEEGRRYTPVLVNVGAFFERAGRENACESML